MPRPSAFVMPLLCPSVAKARHRIRRWFLVAAGLTLCAAAAAQPAASALPAPVVAALRQAGLPSDALFFVAGPAQAPADPVLRWQADQRVNPASVMKLVTTAAALDLLGPDFIWTTHFLTNGTVAGGLLRGDLVIQGGGDPKWVVERIEADFQALRQLGVQVVHGDVLLDHGAFQLPPIDPAAFDGEHLRPYNAAPDAVLVNFKSVVMNFSVDATARVARVQYQPPLAGVSTQATVPLTDGPCGDWRSTLGARLDQPHAIRFTGAYPARCGERTWPFAYADPQSFAHRALEGLWRAQGGLLTGRIRSGTVPQGARVLHTGQSMPLADIVGDINTFSNNVMAQQLFLTLGRGQGAAAGSAVPATFERARNAVQRWWVDRFGSQLPPPLLDNGSGLSRQERVSAEALYRLLQDVVRRPHAEVLMRSLPRVGVDGTAARMGERGILKLALGKARVKTGSLRDVTAVAGYVPTRSGRLWAVVAIVNHPLASQARPVMDAALEWAAQQAQ